MNVERVRRVVDVDTANELIGDRVPAVEANINRPVVLVDDDLDRPVAVYGPWPGDRPSLARYRRALLDVPFNTTTKRAGAGFQNLCRTFGFAASNVVLKREGCRASKLASEAPEAHATIAGAASTIQTWLAEHVPEVVADGHDAEVADGWRLTDDTYWTSGVVNLSSSLPYHRDRNNHPVWSAMPVVRRGTRGGHLHVPEYDATFACRDGWVLAFPGAELVHGVTPITASDRDGYRISAVYYCLAGMRNCHDDALAQARERRTARESAIADEVRP